MLKKTLLMSLSFSLCQLLSAQPDMLPDSDSTEVVEVKIEANQMPYFAGCSTLPEGSVEKRNCSNQALISFISKNLEIPKNMEETGSVYLNFLIDEQGKVSDPSVLRGLSKAQNDAALLVVNAMPVWEPARLNDKPVKIKMTLPIRFSQKDESEFSNGFQLTWGSLKGATVDRETIAKYLQTPITVRDESGNSLEINELLFERERNGKYSDAKSNGTVTQDMQQIVKKLHKGDSFTVTATVQKKGQFFYVDKSFKVD